MQLKANWRCSQMTTLPIPSFLQAWAKFLDTKLDYELLGGSIIPLFETPPQSWLVADQHLCTLLFGQRDLPEGPVEPAKSFGGNMAVRRSVFNSGFRFKEDIGQTDLTLIIPWVAKPIFASE